jgi:hypothetical protein
VKRWVEAAPGRGFDAHLGKVFREVPDEEPLSNDALASVGRRLARDRRRRARWRTLRSMPVVFAVLGGGAGVAFGEWVHPGFWHLRGWRPFSAHTAVETSDMTVHASQGVHSVDPPAPSAEPPTDEVAPTFVAPENRALPRSSPIAPKAQAETPPDPSPEPAVETTPRPSSIALESEALQRALAKLRRDHDPRAALALLDDYQARFPHGLLSVEAAAARVDALLLMGRRSEALALLADLPLDRVGRANELRLVRAELYAERDCARALADFESVLASPVSADLAERALYGRAGCRMRSADVAGGRDDLRAYLKQYPSGRFAAEVRARLGSP